MSRLWGFSNGICEFRVQVRGLGVRGFGLLSSYMVSRVPNGLLFLFDGGGGTL